ncbi:MAG TPA: hypothetical protein VH139_10270 [Acidobacteriaceae bacterium]|nr:hypothetical protein [Acidobacteriaceae bacterium]
MTTITDISAPLRTVEARDDDISHQQKGAFTMRKFTPVGSTEAMPNQPAQTGTADSATAPADAEGGSSILSSILWDLLLDVIFAPF